MPFLPPLVSLLADAAPVPLPSDPSSYQSAGWLLLGLAGLAGAVNQVMGVLEKFRSIRTPEPGSVSADRVKALEDRMHAMEISVATSMGSINTQMENIKSSLTHIVSDFNYAIGRIDGRAETPTSGNPSGL